MAQIQAGDGDELRELLAKVIASRLRVQGYHVYVAPRISEQAELRARVAASMEAARPLRESINSGSATSSEG